MAYDLEEQEQIEGLKAFWKRYGNFFVTAITVVLLAIAGYRGWNAYQDVQASEAAAAYEQVRQAAGKPDLAKLREASGVLFDRFAGTAYASMAALVSARAHADGGDAKSARSALQWAIDHGDEATRHVARVRLAGMLIDEKAFDDAAKLLAVEPPPRFAAMYADRRGDLLLAQDKPDDARAAWKLALERLEPNAPLRRLVQLKLDGVGGSGS